MNLRVIPAPSKRVKKTAENRHRHGPARFDPAARQRFPFLSARAENTGNTGVAFPDIGATSPDNAQIVSCYLTGLRGAKSALRPYRISVFRAVVPRLEVGAQILSCIFPDYGGWRMAEFAPGSAPHELAPSQSRRCGGLLQSRRDRGISLRKRLLFWRSAPQTETAECAHSGRNARTFRNDVRLCEDMEVHWYRTSSGFNFAPFASSS